MHKLWGKQTRRQQRETSADQPAKMYKFQFWKIGEWSEVENWPISASPLSSFQPKTLPHAMVIAFWCFRYGTFIFTKFQHNCYLFLTFLYMYICTYVHRYDYYVFINEKLLSLVASKRRCDLSKGYLNIFLKCHKSLKIPDIFFRDFEKANAKKLSSRTFNSPLKLSLMICHICI